MDYWEEVISEACDEADLKITREQIQIIGKYVANAYDYYGESHGTYYILNPQVNEIEKLEKALKREAEKTICKSCKGTGEYIFHGPTFTSSSECHVCGRSGFIYGKY